MDILMMALLGGRDRTEQEFQGLYQRAGLRLTKIVSTASMLSIVEGVRGQSSVATKHELAKLEK
jgi:hypothetical protein